jgi:hypothetical protein
VAQSRLLRLFGLEFALLGVLAAALGCALGWLVQWGLAGPLAEAVAANGPRTHYMRARLSAGPALPRVTPFERQDSALLRILTEADALLISGADPRKEAPVLNARIRKRWAQGRFPVGIIGPAGLDL